MGKVDGITGPAATFTAENQPAIALQLDPAKPYHDALARIQAQLLAELGGSLAGSQLAAVAHRVVHGGSKYFEPVLLDAVILKDLRSYIPLAPLHQPFALDAIELLFTWRPNLPQVACFDTGFHRTMPRVEQMFALPYSAWQRGVRRYGFHGLSYEFISIALAERYGASAQGKTIAAHLGSGASLCALDQLKSVATTMGFSALDGLVMGTRCGTLDPGALLYLMQLEHLSVDQVSHLLYHESGLLGVSGVSSDPRELFPREADNARVADALALYVRRIVREVGALVAVLGGLDLLVFSAGIGEHNPTVRQRVCSALAYLGIELDLDANARNAPVISTAQSALRVAVEPTNEEWIAARAATHWLLHVAADPGATAT
jgi:acetate kinase